MLRLWAVLLVFLGLTPVLWPVAAGAQVRDLSRSWHTVQTEHFEVHYHEPLALLARRVAEVLERAHARLAPVLRHEPKRRVQIALTDGSEFANGSATPLPYNIIRLFATAPEDLSVLGDFDDWMTTLITHEHAHILHLDNIGGIPAIINKVFGKIYSPNLAEPRWIIEGIATYFESALTSGGRLRSTQFEMYMRTAVLEDATVSIDQLSNQVVQWPRGNLWYLYGSRFVEYIVNKYGEDWIAEMATLYGKTLIPYGLNRALKKVTGKAYVELYDEWLDHLRVRYGTLANEIREQGIVEGRRLTFHGQLVRGLRFRDNEHLIFYVEDGENDPQIRSMELKDPTNWKRVVRARGESYPTVDPDGHIYYESIDSKRYLYNFYDLFRVRKRHRHSRLTRGLRGRHPDISPDGTRVAFIQNHAGTTDLRIAELDDIARTQRVLVESKPYEQAYTPRFSPDGTKIAFSVWRRGGYRDIHILELSSGEITRVTHDRAMDTGPAWSADGSELYFSSDRTGIANIYRWNPQTQETVQVTNVISGAYHPAPSPDGKTLAYIGYTSLGFDVFAMELDETKVRPAEGYIDDRPSPSEGKNIATAFSHRYHAARTLQPRYWSLDLAEDGFGQQLGVTIQGEDAAPFYSWGARVGVSLEEGYVNFDGRYSFLRFPAPVTLRFFRRVDPRGGLVVDDIGRQWLANTIGGSATMQYSFFRSFHTNTLSGTYTLRNLDPLEPFGGDLDPNSSPPTLPRTGLFSDTSVSWRYTDVRAHTFDMFPSKGRAMSLGVAYTAAPGRPDITPDFRETRLTWSWQRFIENPWVQHHVLAINYNGGTSDSNQGQRGVFSIGGFAETNFIDDLINQTQLGGTALRGYEPFSDFGSRFHLLQAEYRFPISFIQRGPQTVPLYIDRMWASVFVDWGDAYFNKIDPSDFRWGVGAELFTRFTVGYYLFYTLRLGLAYGINEGGGLHFYAQFGVPF